ncbi:MAG TPA: ComEA family DNA-binding protein [Gryllotalpicola sp.]
MIDSKPDAAESEAATDDAEPDDADGVLRASARARPRWRIGLGAAVVLLVLGVGVAVVAGLLAPGGGVRPVQEPIPAVGAAVTPAPLVSAPSFSTPAASAAPVVVHVLGQVAHPGVYELPSGSRALDAIGAAGGFAAAADRSGLNLARVLADGEQLFVPKPGESPPAAAAPAPLPAGPGAGSGSGTGPLEGGRVDLNTATLEQLETLPRVGPALGQRILDWRAQNGRFASVDDLKNVSGIGDKTFAGLRELVEAR